MNVPNPIRNRFSNLSDSVDSEFFHPEKSKPLKRKITEPIILLPSRITLLKGHLDALKALRQLRRNGINATLVFAGKLAPDEKTAFMEKLHQLVSEEGLRKHVVFAGEQTAEELRDWYAASTIVILPTYAEGLGKVLLEAQAMEKPVIAYDSGGVPEAILDGATGYMVKKGHIEGLANRLKELIEQPEKQKEMGRLGRIFIAERFTAEALTTRHEEFYIKALNMIA